MVRRRINRAFTLIELLLVLVILAVLAAVVIPKLTGRVAESKIKATIAQISNLKSALENYENDNGKYPDNSVGLDALVNKPADATEQWHKQMDEVPTDSWNNAFKYELFDDNTYEITSAGPNGQFDGQDDITTHTKVQ